MAAAHSGAPAGKAQAMLQSSAAEGQGFCSPSSRPVAPHKDEPETQSGTGSSSSGPGGSEQKGSTAVAQSTAEEMRVGALPSSQQQAGLAGAFCPVCLVQEKES